MWNREKWRGWTCNILIALLPGVCLAGWVEGSVTIGAPHPALVLRSASSDAIVSIDSHRGKKVVLVHVAGWSDESGRILEEWLTRTAGLRKEGKLEILAVLHEQRRDAAGLFVQWKKLTIPVMHDPLNLSEAAKLPMAAALDENGFVRAMNPAIGTDSDWKKFEKSFLKKRFKPGKFEIRTAVLEPPNPRAMKRIAEESRSPDAERDLADALMLSGTPPEIDEAMRTYSHVLQEHPRDAYSFFRLGTALQNRFEGDERQAGDDAKALECFRNALTLSPKNVIFRAKAAEFDAKIEKPKGGADLVGWIRSAKSDVPGGPGNAGDPSP